MKTKQLSLKSFALAVTLLCGAVTARADITVYTNRADFLSAISAPAVDNYNDLQIQWYPDPLKRTAGAYEYTVAADNGLFGGGTASDGWLTTNLQGDPIRFTDFSRGVTGFGGNFFGSNVFGQFIPNTSVILVAGDGTTRTYELDNTTTNTFLGFVSSTGLTSVSLVSAGSYWPTANDVTLGMAAPVPEPGTWAMLLAGMSLLGAAMRRRR
jgi:hypothetical protein